MAKLSKVCFQLITFNSDEFLDEAISTVEKFGTVVATEGPVRWWAQRGFTQSTDKTLSILAKHKVRYVSGAWQEKDQMANASIHLVPEKTRWLWVFDSDELYHTEDIERVLGLLETEQYDAVAFKALSFFAGFENTMGGFEYNFPVHRIQRYYPGCQWATHRPPTINAPNGLPWREHKFLSEKDTEQLGIFLHHYSYCLPRQTKAKIKYYESMGGTIPSYFQEVWLRWARGDAEERQRIENIYDGVHNWIPSRRGASRTIPFQGKHPLIIEQSLPRLRERFDRELAEYGV